MKKTSCFLIFISLIVICLFLSSCTSPSKTQKLSASDTLKFTHVKKTITFKGICATGWLDELNLICIDDNEKVRGQFEDGERYLQSVFKYNLLSKKKSLLVESGVDIWETILSPDGRCILCIGGGEGTREDFIYNLKTGQTIPLNENGFPDNYIWVNNRVLQYTLAGTHGDPEDMGGIYSLDVNGQKKRLWEPAIDVLSRGCMLGDKVFYIGSLGKLYMETSGQRARVICEDVSSIYPSPGKPFIAAVREAFDNKGNLLTSEVVIIDLQGNEVNRIKTESRIESLSWSPDGSKIICAGSSFEVRTGYLFLVDLKTGKTVQLSLGPQYTVPENNWHPGGKKVLVRYFDGKEVGTIIMEF